MIVYAGTKKDFDSHIINGEIVERIEEELRRKNIRHNNQSEVRSWDNSLKEMYMVLNDPTIEEDIHVAIEYKIPTTSKRVDFIISGQDEFGKDNVVIVELKQWERATRTSRPDLVTTFINKGIKSVVHPAYQAFSYAKTIENYNAYVEEAQVNIIPCSYLHNFKEEFRKEIENELYRDIIELSPVYLKRDALKLREFIKRYIKISDQGKTLYQIDHGKIRPSKALQDAVGSMIKGNDEFVMIDEQKVVFETIRRLVDIAVKNNKKYTIIVEGGPGTGKSVVAVNLLTKLRNLNVSYVTKNAAPRNVYFSKLRGDKYKLSYIKNLFKGSGMFVDSEANTFDCLIVDEAHRLNQKSGMFANLGENQIKEIIQASRVSVFFIDEDQIVTTKDFGSIEEIKQCAKLLGSQVYAGEEYNLVSQFRCNGSDGYIAFLDDVLEIRETANYDSFDMDYDIKIYNDPNKMRDDLREINKLKNKARMIAGYCYEWKTQKNPKIETFDIELENGFKAKWNFGSTQTWAIDEDSFEQVGCIHTAQGLEFDYVGIIIGPDMYYENGRVVTDFTKRAKTDASLRGIKTSKNYELADRIIRNTYKTLMSRGQKGCYIYCEDKTLSEYLERRLAVTQNK